MPFASALTRALGCRERGDDVGLLGALLEAWRLVPDPALAAVIEEVSLRLERAATRKRDPFDRQIKHRVWRELALRNEPHELGWLLGVLVASAWVSTHDLELFVNAKPDPRIAARLPALRRRLPREGRALDKLCFHDPPAAPIPATARELHDRVVRPTLEAQAVERGWLEQVWAHPDDDGPRAVYADWLLEREHPRGELISLQLGGELDEYRQRRQRRLLDRFFDDWLGGISSAVAAGTFARGFLDVALVRADPAAFTPTRGRPEWSTVRQASYTSTEHAPAFIALITHPIMRSLRSVHVVHDVFFELARSGAPTGLTELGLRLLRPLTSAEGAVAEVGAAFPHVRSLVCRPPHGELSWLAGSQFGSRLEHIQSACTSSEALRWLRSFADGGFPRLRELELELRGAGTLVVRDAVLHAQGVAAWMLAELLDGLAPGTFEGVHHDSTDDADRRRVRAAIARQGGPR